MTKRKVRVVKLTEEEADIIHSVRNKKDKPKAVLKIIEKNIKNYKGDDPEVYAEKQKGIAVRLYRYFRKFRTGVSFIGFLLTLGTIIAKSKTALNNTQSKFVPATAQDSVFTKPVPQQSAMNSEFMSGVKNTSVALATGIAVNKGKDIVFGEANENTPEPISPKSENIQEPIPGSLPQQPISAMRKWISQEFITEKNSTRIINDQSASSIDIQNLLTKVQFNSEYIKTALETLRSMGIADSLTNEAIVLRKIPNYKFDWEPEITNNYVGSLYWIGQQPSVSSGFGTIVNLLTSSVPGFIASKYIFNYNTNEETPPNPFQEQDYSYVFDRKVVSRIQKQVERGQIVPQLISQVHIFASPNDVRNVVTRISSPTIMQIISKISDKSDIVQVGEFGQNVCDLFKDESGNCRQAVRRSEYIKTLKNGLKTKMIDGTGAAQQSILDIIRTDKIRNLFTTNFVFLYYQVLQNSDKKMSDFCQKVQNLMKCNESFKFFKDIVEAAASAEINYNNIPSYYYEGPVIWGFDDTLGALELNIPTSNSKLIFSPAIVQPKVNGLPEIDPNQILIQSFVNDKLEYTYQIDPTGDIKILRTNVPIEFVPSHSYSVSKSAIRIHLVYRKLLREMVSNPEEIYYPDGEEDQFTQLSKEYVQQFLSHPDPILDGIEITQDKVEQLSGILKTDYDKLKNNEFFGYEIKLARAKTLLIEQINSSQNPDHKKYLPFLSDRIYCSASQVDHDKKMVIHVRNSINGVWFPSFWNMWEYINEIDTSAVFAPPIFEPTSDEICQVN